MKQREKSQGKLVNIFNWVKISKQCIKIYGIQLHQLPEKWRELNSYFKREISSQIKLYSHFGRVCQFPIKLNKHSVA